MRRFILNSTQMVVITVFATATLSLVGCAGTTAESDGAVQKTKIIKIKASGFALGANKSVFDGTNQIRLELNPVKQIHFSQSAVKQSTAPVLFGPDSKTPYFTVRFAMPIPPSNATNEIGALTGIDPMVFTHNHSPGFEILPNGDALAVYFSTPPGKAEADISTSFAQARLRYGSEEWDMPELFFKTENFNDQSGLLWKDKNKIWFFGGGRDISDSIPFRIAVSTNSGTTWKLSLPQLDKPAESFTAQPITSAFRDPNGAIYMAMDGDGAQSFLWRSTDEGAHWHDMGGRTSGRHSVIMPLNDRGHLLSIGGKNSSTNDWSPMNTSSNWGKTWSAATPSPFPPLGTAQRPSLIRLADGNLFFVSDSYVHKGDKPPPEGWAHGNEPFVAISTNNGSSWHIKLLPVKLPHHTRPKHGSVGYVTARQAPNGVIHILTSVTQPCLHYELNEAWVFSAAGEVAVENRGGEIKAFSEKYPNGKLRSTWTARICPNGRYLLDGLETDYYENGRKQREVTYTSGRKTGTETFWTVDGTKLWTWESHPEKNTAVWTHYWPNGRKKIQSAWNTKPTARDLDRSFLGFVAHGPSYQWNEDGSSAGTYDFINGSLSVNPGKNLK